jgi:hypothetical protein
MMTVGFESATLLLRQVVGAIGQRYREQVHAALTARTRYGLAKPQASRLRSLWRTSCLTLPT